MKKKLIQLFRRVADSPLGGLLSPFSKLIMELQVLYFRVKWKLQKAPMPTPADISLVRENVTFIYKSFQRQRLAKGLYQNIQAYYPGVQVIIADDSKKPLKLESAHVQVLHLPFNSGVSRGINCALEQVKTPYVIRLDDDMLLTPYTNFHGQLRFLMDHPEVDLVAVSYIPLPQCDSLAHTAKQYYRQNLHNTPLPPPLPLKIPHLTYLDEKHVVLSKPANIFLTRTEAIRKVGYDNNIRMIDHNEFFWRAAGVLVSVMDPSAYMLHRHEPFDKGYQKYRNDIQGDQKYILRKMYTRIQTHKEDT